MRQSTRDGELTVISDAVSCSEGFVHELEYEGVKDIRVVDAVQYVADEVLPIMPGLPKVASAALHPTCSSTRIDWNASLQRCAEAVADESRAHQVSHSPRGNGASRTRIRPLSVRQPHLRTRHGTSYGQALASRPLGTRRAHGGVCPSMTPRMRASSNAARRHRYPPGSQWPLQSRVARRGMAVEV